MCHWPNGHDRIPPRQSWTARYMLLKGDATPLHIVQSAVAVVIF